jgi:hypothetical protein
VRPVGVECYSGKCGRVYLFPLSAEISKKDRQIQFGAHICRIVLAQDFYLTEMAFLGKLEL